MVTMQYQPPCVVSLNKVVQALEVLAATLHNACLHGMAGQLRQSASLIFMLTAPFNSHPWKWHWINVEVYVSFFEGGQQ